jgi:hypothetical protein
VDWTEGSMHWNGPRARTDHPPADELLSPAPDTTTATSFPSSQPTAPGLIPHRKLAIDWCLRFVRLCMYGYYSSSLSLHCLRLQLVCPRVAVHPPSRTCRCIPLLLSRHQHSLLSSSSPTWRGPPLIAPGNVSGRRLQ